MDLKSETRILLMMKMILISLVMLLHSVSGLHAELTLARPFGNHAVLQHGKPLPVWGTADAGDKILVKLGDEERETLATQDGVWKVEFSALPPSKEGIALEVISGKTTLKREDLLLGDVWIASGQSNMQWMLKQCATANNAILKSEDKNLRFMHLNGTLHPGGQRFSREFLLKMTTENYYSSKGWQRSNPMTISKVSGVGYFFAQKLSAELDIPIGVIQLAVGGSPVEAHMPRSAFEGDKDLEPLLEKWWVNPNYPIWCRGRAALNLTHWNSNPPKDRDPPHPFAPTFLWQAGIEKVAPFPVKGMIWYQGESNAGKDGSPGSITDGSLNKKKFKLLIEAWRKAWSDESMPVYYVQLPGLNRQWPVFREMQLEVSQEVKNVGMAVTMDLGHPTNVHPASKLPVGERLARLALAGTYAKDIVPNGPIYQKSVAKSGKMFISFANGADLKASDGGDIIGFEIAGKNRKFHPASAVMEAKYLEVSSEAVPSPVAVRYAWANDPECNLVNGEDLPASPFRTDKWEDVKPSGNVDKGRVKAMKAEAKNDGKIRVACVGDSITFGHGIEGGQTYPVQLQKMLGDKYEVRNFGNSGRGIVKKSMRGRTKRAFIFMKEHTEALAFEPHIVICNLGINDLGDWDKFGKKDFEQDYSELIKSYRSLSTEPRVIIWHKLAPLFKGQNFFGDKRVEAINDAIANVAKKDKVETIDMETPLIKHGEWFPDHIHPNIHGAKKIAEVTAEMLKKK